jgi:GDP-L-fucose synthase
MSPNDKRFFEGHRVCVAGPTGMVGSAIIRALAGTDCEILPLGRAQVDLLDQQAVNTWFDRERPSYVFLAAAKVGGIAANSNFPADFLYQNLLIETNVIGASHRVGVQKLLFLGSSCIYPKFAPQPIEENALLTGPLEPTNEWYAIAKIAGIKLVEAFRLQYGSDYISAMPTNLYGPGDNFDLQTSHVLPALIAKIHRAKVEHEPSVTLWGSGTPRREFLHVDDCADACVFLFANYSGAQHVNVGSGQDIAILELAKLICTIIGYDGKIILDPTKPDGTPRKLMSDTVLNSMGWKPQIALPDGIASTYEWYLQNHAPN